MKRVLQVLLLVVAGFLLLEAALQLGAWGVRATQRGVDASWLTGDRRVLCLGDSNTYGIRVERDETWPRRLEAVWNEAGREPLVEVLNLGFPGMNSSRIARDFTRLLDGFAPDVVVVMVGANDFWTAPVALDPEREGAWSGLRRLRTVRLFYAMRRALDQPRVEDVSDLTRTDAGSGTLRYAGEEFELGWREEQQPMRAARAGLGRNLRALVEKARTRGISLVLVTYPSREPSYRAASAALREAASETDAALVDLAAAFETVCPEEPCAEYLYRDGHPTARGYALVAEFVAVGLDPLLR